MRESVNGAPVEVGGISIERGVPARMRDGVTLRADIYRPVGDGPLPVLLMRVPYAKELAQSNVFRHPFWFARQGYMVVIQDTRGRWSSDGEFWPYRDEMDDGYDTVEWAAQLPRSNGRVGMYGLSYAGTTQLMAALAQPPHLTAIAPAMTSIDFYKYKTYRGGAFALAFSETWAANLSADAAHRHGLSDLENELYTAHFRRGMWHWYGHLPLKDVPLLHKQYAAYFYEWLAHPTYDAYWKQSSIVAQLERIGVPCLHIGGWYDMYADSTVRAFAELQRRGGTDLARRGQRLIVGPWSHGPSWTQYVGEIDFGDAARPAINEALVRWYDYWLKGEPNGVLDGPPARLFSLGEHRWREADNWPPSGVRPTALYLRSDGGANANAGDGRLSWTRPEDDPPDVYLYNPRNPVPSFGGRTEVDAGRNPVGPFDHRRVEARNDVLVYTTELLTERLELVGPISAVLWAASSATDTDFTVKLLDVWPDGRAYNLADGIIRASYRASLEEPSPIVPYQVYRYDLDVGVTCAVVLPGHRLRVEVSSSNFPAFARHPNVHHDLADYDLRDTVSAMQTVFHDPERPSHVLLPVVAT